MSVSILYLRAKSLNHRLQLSEKSDFKTYISLIYCGLGLDVKEAPLLALGGSAGYSFKMSYKNLLKSYIYSGKMWIYVSVHKLKYIRVCQGDIYLWNSQLQIDIFKISHFTFQSILRWYKKRAPWFYSCLLGALPQCLSSVFTQPVNVDWNRLQMLHKMWPACYVSLLKPTTYYM